MNSPLLIEVEVSPEVFFPPSSFAVQLLPSPLLPTKVLKLSQGELNSKLACLRHAYKSEFLGSLSSSQNKLSVLAISPLFPSQRTNQLNKMQTHPNPSTHK